MSLQGDNRDLAGPHGEDWRSFSEAKSSRGLNSASPGRRSRTGKAPHANERVIARGECLRAIRRFHIAHDGEDACSSFANPPETHAVERGISEVTDESSGAQVYLSKDVLPAAIRRHVIDEDHRALSRGGVKVLRKNVARGARQHQRERDRRFHESDCRHSGPPSASLLPHADGKLSLQWSASKRVQAHNEKARSLERAFDVGRCRAGAGRSA